jgi:hypothetical protein
MIEFILSRVWMIMAGIAVMVVIVAAFDGLQDHMTQEAFTDGAEVLSEMIDAMEQEGQGEVRVEMDALLSSSGTTMEVRPGSIWMHNGDQTRAVECPSIQLVDRGVHVPSITLTRGDAVIIRSTNGGPVQVEKVSATALTPSTNLMHSSTVL